MSSPFPGMDPYIEAPELWSDFHNNLASEIQAQLNQVIRPRYFARLIPYVTYESLEIGEMHATRPDVSISTSYSDMSHLPLTGGVATIPYPIQSEIALEVPLRLYHVEIRSAKLEEVVTVIEILSPVNKRPGHEAFDDYQRKRQRVLRTETVNFVEIDLLRGGKRPHLAKPVPSAAYYIMVSRAETRPTVDVWPVQLADRLPVFPIPLRAPDTDVSFDLNKALSVVYDRAAYELQIDYSQPPPPPSLSETELQWVEQIIQKKVL